MPTKAQTSYGSRMGNAIFLISASNAYSRGIPSQELILIRFYEQFVISVYAAMNIYYAKRNNLI